MLGIVQTDQEKRGGMKREVGKKVSFSEDDVEIINLEDVDPSVGRFRNLVQSTVIPSSSKVLFCVNRNNH